jgi:hypothetical protein
MLVAISLFGSFGSVNYLSAGQSQKISTIDLLGTNRLMKAVVCGAKNGTQIRKIRAKVK